MLMDRKYLLRSQIRVARLARLTAKAIDLVIVFFISRFFFPFGTLLACFYIGFADYFYNGQSFGKKFIGFQVISLVDGGPPTRKQSVVRNLPFLIPTFFLIIPLWGWLFSALFGIPMLCLELHLLFHLDSGHRLGDVMADTTVIANDRHMHKYKTHRPSWFEAEKVIPLR